MSSKSNNPSTLNGHSNGVSNQNGDIVGLKLKPTLHQEQIVQHTNPNGQVKYSPLNSNEKEKELLDFDYEDSEKAECGIGKWKPHSLGIFANMGVFTGMYSLSALLTSTLSSYVNSQVTTLERHFGFNSSQTGLIMAANDIGFLIMVLFVSFIASKVHIPRGLGFFTILFGISGIMCALPQFLYGAPSPSARMKPSSRSLQNNVSYQHGPIAQMSRIQIELQEPHRGLKMIHGQLCDSFNNSASQCNNPNAESSNMAAIIEQGNNPRAHATAALVIIVLGMVIQGVAKTPRSSFTTTYIDNNVDKRKTGFYMGIITAIAIMGPAMAFGIGGLFTRIYVTLEETDMPFKHPKWIGAWWLGYIFFGCASLLVAIPLFCFPRQIKGGKLKKVPEEKPNDTNSPVFLLCHNIKGFLASIVRLVTNPVYTSMVLASCALLFAVAGKGAFTPKYIENQFAFPVWKANLTLAGIYLCTACVGTFVGGYLTKKFEMGPMRSLKFATCCQLLSAIFTTLSLVFYCEQPLLYNSPGPRATADTQDSGCYDNCACDDGDFFPICGSDGRSYFSPCHAGCGSIIQAIYQNCTCVGGDSTAIAGQCNYGCNSIYPYLVCTCFSALFGTLTIIPKLIIFIRSVEERDRAMALGLSSFMTSSTAWMLGPIIFGKLIDGICIQWENTCLGRGSCRLYDNDLFRWKLYGYQGVFRFLGFALCSLALIIAICSKKFEASENKHKENMEQMIEIPPPSNENKNEENYKT